MNKAKRFGLCEDNGFDCEDTTVLLNDYLLCVYNVMAEEGSMREWFLSRIVSDLYYDGVCDDGFYKYMERHTSEEELYRFCKSLENGYHREMVFRLRNKRMALVRGYITSSEYATL